MAWFFVGAGRNASGIENISELLINQALREVGEPTGGGMSRNRISLITPALSYSRGTLSSLRGVRQHPLET